ncbi:MAG: hypothetical protein PHT26_15965 [Lentimicrobiaceae bacterium]|jgi:hypothetical protein|nr:hypothetical protein [Lentimicrobiaceae bacterium]
MKKKIRLVVLSNIVIAITLFTYFSSENVRADVGGAKDLVVTNCGTSPTGQTLYKGTCTGNRYPACSPMACGYLAPVAEIR